MNYVRPKGGLNLMPLKYVEEEIEIPLYNEFDNSVSHDSHRITIGLDLNEDRITRAVTEDVDETIYLDVPTYVRG